MTFSTTKIQSVTLINTISYIVSNTLHETMSFEIMIERHC